MSNESSNELTYLDADRIREQELRNAAAEIMVERAIGVEPMTQDKVAAFAFGSPIGTVARFLDGYIKVNS